MKRSQSLAFRLLIAAFAVAFLGSVTARLQAQTPPPRLRLRKRLRLLRRRGSLRRATSYPAAPRDDGLDHQRSARWTEAGAL